MDKTKITFNRKIKVLVDKNTREIRSYKPDDSDELNSELAGKLIKSGTARLTTEDKPGEKPEEKPEDNLSPGGRRVGRPAGKQVGK